MKRFPNAFYRDVNLLRKKLEGREYNRDTDLLPDVVKLIRDYEHSADELYIDAADRILDNMETAQRDAGPELFPLNEHIPLGGKQRIDRGSMTIAHIRRRERIIDTNKANNDAAWAAEKRVNAMVIDRLADLPADKRWKDVFDGE